MDVTVRDSSDSALVTVYNNSSSKSNSCSSSSSSSNSNNNRNTKIIVVIIIVLVVDLRGGALRKPVCGVARWSVVGQPCELGLGFRV